MDGRGPYGLACLHCFKGKVKCARRDDGGDGCERLVYALHHVVLRLYRLSLDATVCGRRVFRPTQSGAALPLKTCRATASTRWMQSSTSCSK